MKKDRKLLFTILSFIIFILLSLRAFLYQPVSPLIISNGEVNYNGFKFDKNSIYSINEFFLIDSSTSDRDYTHYRLKTILPENTECIALRIPLVFSEFSLYSNNTCCYTNDGSPSSILPFPKVIIIPTQDDKIDFDLTVKNNKILNSLAYNNPVNTNDMYIGTPTAIHSYQRSAEISNYLVIIACLFFCMYHIISSIYHPKRTVQISLSVFCFSVAICLSFSSQTIIHYYFPNLSVSFICRLFLAFSFIKIAAITIYLKQYFYRFQSNLYFNLFFYLSLSLTILSIVLPFSYLCYLIVANIVINTVLIVSNIIINIIYNTQIKLYSYMINLIGLLGFLYGIFTEYLFLLGPHSYFSHFSLMQLFFIALHSFRGSHDYHESLAKVQALTPILNESLNEMQNNPSTYISTHIKPDFLYETLTSINKYIDTDIEQVDRLIQSLAKYLRQALDFSINPTEYSLKKELDNCMAYASLVNEQHKEIKFIFNTDNSLSDTLIPQQAILTLIENSVANAFIGILHPTVTVSATDNGNNTLTVTVNDNGIGMTEEEIDLALNAPGPESDINIFYINNQLINNFNSSLSVSSKPKSGTTISFTVPIVDTEVPFYE